MPAASFRAERHRPAHDRLRACGKSGGRPRSALDMIIAAVAAANGCIVVTANERDFSGMEIVNPLRGDGT